MRAIIPRFVEESHTNMADIGFVIAQVIDGYIPGSTRYPGIWVALNSYICECIPLKAFHPEEVIDVS